MSKRKKYPTVTLTPEVHALLLKYAQSKKLPMSVIVGDFVEKGIEHDIYDPNWIEKFKKAQRVIDGYSHAGDCDGLAPGENKDGDELYSCVWYRPGRPPQIRILGIETLQQGRCAACGRTEEIYLGFKERDERILELETELGARSTEKLKIPKCNRGAILNHDKEDRMIFTGCFRHRGEAVSVEKFCRVYSNGLPCSMYAELIVGVEGKA